MFLVLMQIIGVLLAIVGVTLTLPLMVSLYFKETASTKAFLIPLIFSLVFFILVSLFSYLCNKHHKDLGYKHREGKRSKALSTKNTYIVVSLSWILTSLFGAVPLYLSGSVPSIIDAIFESVSGFSTTGATIINDIEALPRSINLWRCQTHWLGGMGIVALTVALLPLLGVGGFQLIKAETTGPEKGKVTSRITQTAKVLWLIYLILTIIEALLLKLAGMDGLTALSHAFSTLGTGGFSSLNSSIAGFNSVKIDIIISVFMFLAGINFSLYFYLVTGRVKEVGINSELKAYIGIVLFSIISITVLNYSYYSSLLNSLRYSAFQVLSIITTTGFANDNYTLWPASSQVIIFILFFIGGCSGSTGGGIKVTRWVILLKQIKNDIKQLLHPHGVFNIRLNKKVCDSQIIQGVSSFIILYFILIIISTFIGCVCKMDLFTSFTASISMVGNVGPAFNLLNPASTYAAVPALVKVWYCLAMIAGRLELYTILIFFTSDFYKK